MTLRAVIDDLSAVVADVEAEKAEAERDALATGERPDLWEWNVMLDLEGVKKMLAILRALEATQEPTP